MNILEVPEYIDGQMKRQNATEKRKASVISIERLLHAVTTNYVLEFWWSLSVQLYTVISLSTVTILLPRIVCMQVMLLYFLVSCMPTFFHLKASLRQGVVPPFL